MSSPLRMDVTFLLAAIAVTWVCGLKIGFPGFSTPPRSFIQHPKRTLCPEDCDIASPFKCEESPTCLRLFQVCNGRWDCEHGSDEDNALCAAVLRPLECMIWEFLEGQRDWILPNLFNDANTDLVAHALHEAYSMGDLQSYLNLTDQNIENIRNSTRGAIVGDPRPLMALGMPDRAWPEVMYLLKELYNLGLDVWAE
uniref:Neuropeptide prohormone-4 n=1 Tax=Conus victoriae TaxID=319920 RepID=CPROH_CONVC|nr:RecName: Full=Neuropeptide prohormone-4; Flags: Precursor [Conus victoriae]